MHLLFVTPALDGPATGGTLYNRQLLAALGARGIAFEQRSLDALDLAARPVDQVWVDSLYLSALPDLRARFERATRIGLLLHYLPSLLSTATELSAIELHALRAADLIVTPSEYLKELVGQSFPDKPCVCVTPGVQLAQPGGARVRDGTALMICNVTENKGVLPFLRALARATPPAFALAIAGDLQLEAAHAQDCVALCEQHAWLREHVRFLGSLAQHELFMLLAHASVLVSASRMESYGMALAEARALGTPILALPGGNIAHHIAAESGGELAGSPRELADKLCALMADAREQAARLQRARAAAKIRPWSAAAADFIASAVEPRER